MADFNKSNDDLTESVEELEYGGYNVKENSISNIIDLQDKIKIKYIRIMHSEALQSMIGLQRFTRLEEINLSSNSIIKIDGLDGLSNLKILNLSCNKLSELSGLGSLFRLEKLIVSHNKITNLSGLQQMAGPNYNIKSIDLKNNKVRDVKQLQYIQDLSKLQELCFEMGKNSNPLCTENHSIYLQGLTSMRNFQRILRIDGQTPENIIENIKYQGQNQNQNFNNLATLPNSGNQGRNIQIGDQTNPKLGNLNAFPSQSQRPISNFMSFNDQSANKKISIGDQGDSIGDNFKWKGDHLQMQQDLQQALQIQKELINKYEVNDKFWEQKYEKLQEEFNQVQEDNRQKTQKIKTMNKEKQFLEEQISEIKNERIRMLNKTEKREEIVETLQLRITDLIKENGQYHRELAIRQDQTDKQASEIKNLQEDIIEMRGRLRENEQTLSEFHKKALDQTNSYVTKYEQINKKYEQVLEENKLMANENGMLKTRVQELLEITREWEYKYEKKVDELSYKHEQYIRDIQQEFAQREQFQEKQLREWEKAKEDEFKENIEMMEQEFKKYFLENNNRFRELSRAYEEKCKQEQDSRHLMKVAVQKNSDQSNLIEELQNALLKVKKEVAEIVNERDVAQKELDTKKSTYMREVSSLEEERDRLLHDKLSLERQLQDIQDRNMTDNLELERLRAKMKYFENIEEDLEKCQETVQAKNIMLEDKNDTIEDLKDQLEQSRQREQVLNDDFNKIQKKYEKQNQIIEALEEQLQQANEEADSINEEKINLQKELEKKKEIIDIFQSEFNDIKSKQDKEINEKSNKIQDLLYLLEECKQNIRRKDEQIVDLQNEIKERNEKYEVQLIMLQNEQKQKDKAFKELQNKYDESQEDMKQLIIEYEKQKKQTLEQFQKLQKNLFNF
ncbi:hypothetical protein ABPG72_001504 [Tetrahymena utriculariae]